MLELWHTQAVNPQNSLRGSSYNRKNARVVIFAHDMILIQVYNFDDCHKKFLKGIEIWSAQNVSTDGRMPGCCLYPPIFSLRVKKTTTKKHTCIHQN